jgi:hypothetical protein
MSLVGVRADEAQRLLAANGGVIRKIVHSEPPPVQSA